MMLSASFAEMLSISAVLPFLAVLSDPGRLQSQLNSLRLALSVNDVPAIRSFLQQLVTGYQPSKEVVDWVYLEQERQAAEIC